MLLKLMNRRHLMLNCILMLIECSWFGRMSLVFKGTDALLSLIVVNKEVKVD